MKLITMSLFIIILFFGCSKEPQIAFKELPQTKLIPTTFEALPNFNDENFDTIQTLFRKNCKTKQAKALYGQLCEDAEMTLDAKTFITENFTPYMIINNTQNNEGLLTGYYEASIHASRKSSQKYKYPIYATPKDLVSVDLSEIYPELKNYRLRGRVVDNKVVPYYTRAEAKNQELNASVICYCDSLIDRFFLEVQGSGIAKFEDNSTIYLGYDNQNGHKYRSIGKYLIENRALTPGEVSLQSIKKWLLEHPKKADTVLNYNNSMVFFSQRAQGATGALGVELTPMHSIAVDKRYIPLGSMLYLHADENSSQINKVVFAQDTGGAIKGRVRADLFVGSGAKALKIAGNLKAPLELWMLLPKSEIKE